MKAKIIGRPKSANRQTESVVFKMTKDEKKLFQEMTQKKGLRLSAWAKSALYEKAAFDEYESENKKKGV